GTARSRCGALSDSGGKSGISQGQHQVGLCSRSTQGEAVIARRAQLMALVSLLWRWRGEERGMKISSEELKTWGESFEAKQPQDVLTAAVERYAPKIVLACSFGAEDVVLVDMIHRIDPSLPLFYLDTDFLFPETYATRDRIIDRYGLQPQQI